MEDKLPKPSRWFRFSLRTMFVGVAVLTVAVGGWVSYQLNWIRARHEFLRSHPADVLGVTIESVPSPVSLSIFGEKGVQHVYVINVEKNQDKLAQAKKLFPEADCQLTNHGWGGGLNSSSR